MGFFKITIMTDGRDCIFDNLFFFLKLQVNFSDDDRFFSICRFFVITCCDCESICLGGGKLLKIITNVGVFLLYSSR